MVRRYPYEGGLAPRNHRAPLQPSASMRLMDSFLMLAEEAKRSVISKHSIRGGNPLLMTQDSRKPMNLSSMMDCADKLTENTEGTCTHRSRLLASHASKVRTTQRSILGMRRCRAARAKNSAGCAKLPSAVRSLRSTS